MIEILKKIKEDGDQSQLCLTGSAFNYLFSGEI